MKQFLGGLLLGILLTYSYLSSTQLRGAFDEWWGWASRPPEHVADRRSP